LQNSDETIRQKLIETYTLRNPKYDRYKNSHTIDCDVKSIDFIVKLWGTKTAKSYSKLGCIFLTSNATLAYVSRKFTSEFFWDNKNHKSPCVTDYYLGTMIWLSTSNQKVENFSKLKLLADCSAATTLSMEVMDKFLVELKKLGESQGITNEDYLLLRAKAFDKNYLQNLTLNEEDAYKDGIMEQLIEDIKNDIKKPLIHEIMEKEKQIALFNQEDEKRKHDEEKKLEHNSFLEMKGKKLARNIVDFIIPIVTAIFIFMFLILHLLFITSTAWIIIIKIIAGFLSFISVIFFAMMKHKSLYDAFEYRVIKHYKLQDYKQTL
jgi:hypothetical protein